MATGRPIVAANLPVIRELLRDGIEGLLFEPDSVEELAAQVTRVLLEPSLAAELGAGAARRAHSALRWDIAQRSLLAVYDQLLGTSLLSAHRTRVEHRVSGSEWPLEAAPVSPF
jgi:glycosyltransferase involved in cell wall biosynthesis